MSEKVRLEVLTTASRNDGVRLQIERTIETLRKDFDFKLSQLPHIESAVEALKNGTGDLMAMSALDWRNLNVDGLEIVAVLPRREPTWVLVSDDKPEYLHQKALIVCDNELLRRQMRRLRNDLNILTSTAFAEKIGHLQAFLKLEKEERVHWIEECRQDELMDGFVVSRGEHSALRYKSRRHTLGMQRENPERTHFVPPPLYGFTLLASRKGFAQSKIPPVTDSGAFMSHRIESALLDSLPEHLREITGIYVEQRKFRTILKEAQRSGDDFTNESLLDSGKAKAKEGPSKWEQATPRKAVPTTARIQMKIETLNFEGTVSASVERTCTIDESHMGMVNLLKEFEILLDTMQSEHEEMVRRYPGLPEEFSHSRPALLKLDSSQSSSSEEE